MTYTIRKLYLKWCLARNYAFRDEVSRSYQMELARIDFEHEVSNADKTVGHCAGFNHGPEVYDVLRGKKS
jgi:hypothetical protein